jgi:NAD(P)-dependent dehydrogenase (short-subunit alcohol dehydrogenase family)
MQIDLSGKAIVITGAASGIGAAIARQAIASGADKLVLTDRDGEGLLKVANELGGTATVTADLTDFAAPQTIAVAALARFGRIDGLVNAAGDTSRAAVTDGTMDLWDRLMTINARAPFFLMQAAIADMLARKSPGTIVNIQSINAHCGLPELAIYSASKSALSTLTKNAAQAHMADRIRVNGINLGWVATETEDRLQTRAQGPDWLAKASATMPLGRLVEAEEAARLVVYLLAEVSAPLSGEVIDLEQKVSGAPG